METIRLTYLIYLTVFLLLGCAGCSVYSAPPQENFEWSGLISDNDWIEAEAYYFRPMGHDGLLPVEEIAFDKVRAGSDLFGYPAPLENFIKIYRIGNSGEGTIESWINEDASSYILPLYSDEGFVDSFNVWRISSNTFRATPDPLYLDYIKTREHLEKYQPHLENIVDYKIIRLDVGIFAHVLYANWENGSAGKIFSYMLCGSPDENELQPFNLEPYLNRVLSEKEIVQLFRGLSGK